MPDITNYDGRLEQMATYCELMLDNIAKVNNAYHDGVEAIYSATFPDKLIKWKGVNKIGGKTVLWNQLVQNGNFADTSVWSVDGSGTISASDNVLTYTVLIPQSGVFIEGNVLGTIENHKYYFACEVKYNDALPSSNVSIGSGGYTNVSGGVSTLGVWTKISGITTRATGGNDKIRIYVRTANCSVGNTVNVKNVQAVDLTKLYGAGKEPSTPEEFESLFPAEWYPYNTGELLSAGVTEVVSKDNNDTTLQTYSIPTEITTMEGYGWSCQTHITISTLNPKNSCRLWQVVPMRAEMRVTAQ